MYTTSLTGDTPVVVNNNGIEDLKKKIISGVRAFGDFFAPTLYTGESLFEGAESTITKVTSGARVREIQEKRRRFIAKFAATISNNKEFDGLFYKDSEEGGLEMIISFKTESVEAMLEAARLEIELGQVDDLNFSIRYTTSDTINDEPAIGEYLIYEPSVTG